MTAMLQIAHQQQMIFTSVAAATAVAVVAASPLFVRYIMLALGSSQEWLTSMAKLSNSTCRFKDIR